LGETFKWGSGGTPLRSNSTYYDGGDIPWVIIGDLNDGVVTETQSHITQLGLENSSAKWVEEGSVLVAMYGSIGKLGIAGKRLTTNQAIAFTKPDPVVAKYLFYYLMCERQNLLNLGAGATQQNISQTVIKAYQFPLAPLPEQERIVARLEELLSDLEAGVAALGRARAGVKRYKASVLKAACSGDLSPHPPFPAGKGGAGGLGPLPEGWRLVNVEELSDGSKHAMKAGPFGSSLKKEYYVPKGYKIYGQEQVIRGDPHFGDYYIDEERYQQLKSNAVKPGDVLISLVGTIGKVLILPENIEPGIINPRLVKLSFDKNLIDSKYFKIYMETETANHYFSTVSHGETMEILNLGILKKLPVPLPPLEEQRRIVADAERRLESARAVEAAVEAGLRRAARLRQSILKHAFDGRLG
jgi:type I restriction enzyme S subunit